MEPKPGNRYFSMKEAAHHLCVSRDTLIRRLDRFLPPPDEDVLRLVGPKGNVTRLISTEGMARLLAKLM